MHPHPAIIRILTRQRVAELHERGEEERCAARVQAEAQGPDPVGESYRLRDGSWLHLRHDSS